MVITMTCRYPNRYPVLNCFGTVCLLRPDLRTSFLVYISRTPSTRIRRYEFGDIYRQSAQNGVYTKLMGSIDTIWVQRFELNRFLICWHSTPNFSLLYSWEAIILSFYLIRSLSEQLHQPLVLRINHVGVRNLKFTKSRLFQCSWSSMDSLTLWWRRKPWRNWSGFYNIGIFPCRCSV